jgi:hypothetical protein
VAWENNAHESSIRVADFVVEGLSEINVDDINNLFCSNPARTQPLPAGILILTIQ